MIIIGIESAIFFQCASVVNSKPTETAPRFLNWSRSIRWESIRSAVRNEMEQKKNNGTTKRRTKIREMNLCDTCWTERNLWACYIRTIRSRLVCLGIMSVSTGRAWGEIKTLLNWFFHTVGFCRSSGRSCIFKTKVLNDFFFQFS